MSNVKLYSKESFDSIKHFDDSGREYWLARELQVVLEYSQWRNFENVIERSKTACINSGVDISAHFADVSKMVNLGVGTERRIQDIALSRYACYLIVQNGDPRKEIIALGQTYFAIQTRRQELGDEKRLVTEDEKRLTIRKELVEHNKSLAEAAKMAGIVDPRDYAIFQNRGYQGLYGGLSMHDIHARKGLKKSEKILDFMGSTEKDKYVKYVLLTADGGKLALSCAISAMKSLKIDVSNIDIFQVPHHGSVQNITPAILNAIMGVPVPESTCLFCKKSIASVSANADEEHPADAVRNAILQRGSRFCTTAGTIKHFSCGAVPPRKGYIDIKYDNQLSSTVQEFEV